MELPPSHAARDAARAGLYVHVPFCATRCNYCDFSTGSLSSAAVERYLAAIEREIHARVPEAADTIFGSVFFGGGTPSALSSRHFLRLWSSLRAGFRIAADAEITLEANPESVRPALLATWRSAGVNRLSMGAQSFVPEELAALGRIHSASRPAEAIALARVHGFERLSLDLMFGFPGQTRARWRHTMDRAIALGLEHLSAYCFIPEPGTLLGGAVISGRARLPEADEQAERYEELVSRLEDSGYGCYETSNFCLPEGEARHNLVYWLRRPYLGLGPSAHGLWKGVRYGNHYALARWADALEAGQKPEAEREPHVPRVELREILMLGLRLSGGIDARDHDPSVWRALVGVYRSALVHAVDTGRLEGFPSGWRIPARHRFVADDVIAWIEARAERARFDSDREHSIIHRSCRTPLSQAI